MSAGVPGDVEVEVGAVAHGGHCVARADGRVVFVRHALPGERVRARLTEAGTDARFWRADAVEVLRASPDRVPAPCPAAGPGGCGGCDWQHVSPAAQRGLKGQVVAEQLRRLAGLTVAAPAEAAGADETGLGWRTRVRLAVDASGRAGLRVHRSHTVLPLPDCPLAHPALGLPDLLDRSWPPGSEVTVVGGSADGSPPTVVVTEGGSSTRVSGPARRHERAAGRTWTVTGSGFWQVHPQAADVLVRAVREVLRPRPGERLLDLYSGVGLFAGSLAAALGPHGDAVAVEADRDAVRDARRSLHDVPTVRLEQAPVRRYLASAEAPERVDIVVLDPPRSGARARVCAEVARRRPRALAYVACDPASLARDTAVLAEHGYALTSLRVLDLFPMTHHVECVAGFEPVAPPAGAVVG